LNFSGLDSLEKYLTSMPDGS